MNGCFWSNAFSTIFRFCMLSIVWGATLAGSPRLVRDINAKPVAISSYPTDFSDLGSVSLFAANDGVHGLEPWTTDGTVNGTFMWGDLAPGVSGGTGRQPIKAGSKVYILQSDFNSGISLWVSAGTPQTTQVISNSNLTIAGVNAGPIGALGNNFIFTVFNTSTSGRELWLSDGTDSGTRKVASSADTFYSIASSTIAGSKLYFMSLTPSGIVEPWVSDGTTAGTHKLANIPNSIPENISVTDFARAGNYLLFFASTSGTGRELWRIDVRDDSISQVRDIASGTGSSIAEGTRFGIVNNTVVFSASVTADSNVTLWRTDGTTAGTFSIAGIAVFNDLPAYIGTSTSRILFRVIVNGVAQLWSTDGSATGTQLIRDPAPYPLIQVGSHFYFLDETQKQVWTTDGTSAGTKKLSVAFNSSTETARDITGDNTAIYIKTSNALHAAGNVYKYVLANSATTLLASYSYSANVFPSGVFAFAQGHLYFDNEDPLMGDELWISDGTAATTRLLKNIAPETQTLSSAPADFVRLNGELFFTADDGDHGREIWHSDGTDAGTKLLIDLNSGTSGSSPSDLFVANGHLYFFAIDATANYQLWISDGTAVGTRSLGQVMPISTSLRGAGCDSKGVVMNANTYFAGSDNSSGVQLWKTDGTNAGTQRVTNITTPILGTFGVCYLTTVGNRIFFQGNAGTNNSELWISDGTAAGTSQLADIFPGASGSVPSMLTNLGGKLYFLANDGTHGTQLWTSDGTNMGTRISTAFASGTPTDIRGPVAGKLLVTIRNTGSSPIRTTLWATDGTTATQLSSVASIYAGTVFVNNGFAYFSGFSTNGATTAVEPWVSDGTAAGTHVLFDTTLGGVATSDTYTDFDGITVFQMTASGGRQLWRTNGTAIGTKPMGSFEIGTTRLAANHILFHIGNDGFSGAELFAIDNSPPIAANDSFGTVEAGKATSLSVVANDSDADGSIDASSVTIASQPSGGAVAVGANGVLIYTARTNFVGNDSFTYAVADDQGFVSSPATIQISVSAPVSAQPSSASGGGGGGSFKSDSTFLCLALLAIYRHRRIERQRYFSPLFERVL